MDTDAEARFAALFAVVVEPVRRYLARRTDPATAEDVLSETALVCWRRLDDVPADAPVAWAVGVARRCLDNARRSERRREHLVRRISSRDRPGAVAGRDAVAEGARDAVAVALEGLGERDAEVLRLWAWEDLAAREIALVLGIGVNAATVRLHRAKGRLRARLGEDGTGDRLEGEAP